MDKTNQSLKEMGIIDPKERIKALTDHASRVVIDPNIAPKRYYRTGVEMVRLADMNMQDGSYENAFTLYMKFITLFVDKIRSHPQYNNVSTKDKAMNKDALRIVIPKAEKLKKQLLEQYQAEFDKYLEDLKERERIERERLRQEELQRQKEEENKRNKMAALAAVKAAKTAITVNVPMETKHLPSIASKTVIDLANDDKALKTSKEIKTPIVDRSTKPSLLTSNGLSLRDIILPTKLMHNFLTLAFSNTTSNKETCGILAGRLERNKLMVTHLLIPEQTGTPDSCTTHNEEDIFDYQDQHNLITLGWIHTHPTQTAFLSSVDLHTHCAYQLMMAEAIAIVCAPKYDEYNRILYLNTRLWFGFYRKLQRNRISSTSY
ncbi:PREDICTED: STAM-binding protein isoform X2 [Atta colombica]|uniref:STAM-binding protein isoform X2 n=1 Tax=Atta colombica TaxID=520822 RepID=UPI00084C5251|nr:PREDICTED: STAM-binding protein isoform X2 [Atta colombica]